MRRLLAAVVVGSLLLACPAIASQAFPSVRGNPANRLASVPIDDFRYDFARHCTRHPRPGMLALQHWLERHFRGVSWGIMRCSKLNERHYSLHAEGRALDWHLDVHNASDRAAAKRLIHLLLAPDRLGNAAALARRMGVQEIIWDCRTWWAGAERLDRYHGCFSRNGKRRRHVDDTTAHRNHVHIGLNRGGAARLTTFWKAR